MGVGTRSRKLIQSHEPESLPFFFSFKGLDYLFTYPHHPAIFSLPLLRTFLTTLLESQSYSPHLSLPSIIIKA